MRTFGEPNTKTQSIELGQLFCTIVGNSFRSFACDGKVEAGS